MTQSSSTRRTVKATACACAALLVAVATLLTFDARSRNVVLASLPQRLLETVTGDGAFTETSSAEQRLSAEQASTDNLAATESTMKPVNGSVLTTSSTARDGAERRPESHPRHQAETARQASQLLTLPEPDPYGLVLLSEPGTYDAGSISWPGSHLILRGALDTQVTIVVATRPLQLRATEVTLENVNLRLASTTSTTTSLSQIRSQKLTCRNCGFLTPNSSPANNKTTATSPAINSPQAIQWAPIDPSDPLAGNLEFSRCQFVGSHSSILLAAAGQNVRCVNTLKIGGGPLFIATGQAAVGDNTFEIEHSTLRNSGSLIAIDLRNAPPWKSRLTIKPVSSVFDLQRRSANEAESLVTFVGGRLQLSWHERVSFDGDDSIAGSSVELASWQANNGSEHQSLDATEVSVQGLMQSEFTFRGPPNQDRTNSLLMDAQVNRLSAQLPGISINSGGNANRSDNEILLIGPEAIKPEVTPKL